MWWDKQWHQDYKGAARIKGKSRSPGRVKPWEPYLVCGQCSAWLYTRKVPSSGLCACGGIFGGGSSKGEGGGGKRHKGSAQSPCPTETFKECISSLLAVLPEDQRAKFEADFPAVLPSAKVPTYTILSRAWQESSKRVKVLGDKVHHKRTRLAALEEQLAELKVSLAEDQAELELAKIKRDEDQKVVDEAQREEAQGPQGMDVEHEKSKAEPPQPPTQGTGTDPEAEAKQREEAAKREAEQDKEFEELLGELSTEQRKVLEQQKQLWQKTAGEKPRDAGQMFHQQATHMLYAMQGMATQCNATQC